MIDYQALMQVLSMPRPDGSAGERKARQQLKEWLDQHGIAYQVHPFRQTPFFFEWIGLWIIITRSLLTAAVWLRWGWVALLISVLSIPGGLVDYILHIPLVTWLGMRVGENLIIPIEPTGTAEQEAILSAHYDSKTELLDHHQRMFFLRNLPVGILLTLATGVLAAFERQLRIAGAPAAAPIYFAGVALTIPLLFLAWGLGLNLSLGRLLPQSQGAVDNGTACAILLGLAAELIGCGEENQGNTSPLRRTRVTLALFSGEEINFQGSRAYAERRSYPLTTVVVNMEAMAQDGGYVTWEFDGSLFRQLPTSVELNAALAKSVEAVSGEQVRSAGHMLSDGGSFLAAGIPAAVLGTYDRELRDTGFHRPTDNLARVDFDRLGEGAAILAHFLKAVDEGTTSQNSI